MEVGPRSPQWLQLTVISNFAAGLLAIRGLVLKFHPQDCGRPHMEASGLLSHLFDIRNSV